MRPSILSPLIWILPLLGSPASASNVTVPSTFHDTLSFIDAFVKEWKLENPDLDAGEISRIHNTANKLKGLINNPPPPLQVRTYDSDEYQAPVRRQLLHHSVQANGTLNSPGNSTLDRAKEIVRLAQKEANERNKLRFANPRVNTYYDHLHSAAAKRARLQDNESLTINETIAKAAAIVAEAATLNSSSSIHASNPSKYDLPPDVEAMLQESNMPVPKSAVTLKRAAAAGGASWWMENIDHRGKVPYGGDASYKVFRNVRDYGAVGDGKTDDTAAINKAMSDGGRCGANCGSSTVKPAIVYFPAGTYLVSTPILMYYNTQMIGNVNDLPIVKAAKSFVGLGVVSSDVYYEGGGGGNDEWYINQNNFLRQLRNFIIDYADTDMKEVAGLHWQVAQATSIHNVRFYGSSSKDSKQIGVFAENGSGGFMSSLTFLHGGIGLRCGNQQFTSTALTFFGTRTAIDMLWDWGWTWKNLFISSAEVGIMVGGKEKGGSLMVLDSVFSYTKTGISVKSTAGTGADIQKNFALTLQHVRQINVPTMVQHAAGAVLDGKDKTTDSWVFGKVYDKASPQGRFQKGANLDNGPGTTSGGLFKDKQYFYRTKSQYDHLDANDFLNAGDLAKGDGVTDDSFSLALMIATAGQQQRPLYIPMGSYIVTEKFTYVTTNSVIVGECWSQIVAKGDYFADANNPKVMLEVGFPDDTGSIEIQDLMLTVEGPTAGAILMEINTSQDTQGSVAIWDTHFRVGGAKGSHLQTGNCPKLTGQVNKNCMAASMLLHMSLHSSGYLENVWAWVADHDLDSGTSQTQIDIYVGRGILIESARGPVWLYGTSSEHSVLYQYQLYGAENVFMSMIQTESPYYLPKPKAPAPFPTHLDQFVGDPTFADCSNSNPHCAAAWGLSIIGSTNVHILGAGMYNWFQDYTQPCVDSQDCQQRVLKVKDSGKIWLYNLYTIGTVEMLNHGTDKPILAKANTNMDGHPFTSIINAWLVAYDGEGDITDDGDDDDDYEDPYEPAPVCTGRFPSLTYLIGLAKDFEIECVDEYFARTALDVLSNSISKYDNIVSHNYAYKFGIYAGIVKDQAIENLDRYMKTQAPKSGFFHCAAKNNEYCCGSVCAHGYSTHCPDDDTCAKNPRYCRPEAFSRLPQCPREKEDYPDSLSFILDDRAGFFKELADKYGIAESWVDFVRYSSRGNYGCVYNLDNPDDYNKCLDSFGSWWDNYPVIKKDMHVFNPADIIKRAYDQTRQLSEKGESMWLDASFGLDLASFSDLADSIMLPALVMEQAMDSMVTIVQTADKELKNRKKDTILSLITAALMVIPIAGEVAGAAGAAVLRITLNLAAELANIGQAVYDIVDDPKNSALSIVGLLLGGVSRQPFRDAANAFRRVDQGKISQISKDIAGKIERGRAVRNPRCRK